MENQNSHSNLIEYIKNADHNQPVPTQAQWADFTNNWLSIDFRRTYCTNFSWAIITAELIDELVKICQGKRVVDIGCGSGFLLGKLKERGIDIVGYDSRSTHNFEFYHPDVEFKDYRDIELKNFDLVIISWPSYDHTEINQVIENMHDGQLLVHCGESHGGCTGDDDFNDCLESQFVEVPNNLAAVEHSWMSIHDHWNLLKKTHQEGKKLCHL